ncbi:hypothetical protein F4780DRAFT_722279 [Xylariomycetidae sp. FL0641]|nr:hypothetical protein F4780DRAFT_722279 [Xylariomycetidae sp. FL0641]
MTRSLPLRKRSLFPPRLPYTFLSQSQSLVRTRSISNRPSCTRLTARSRIAVPAPPRQRLTSATTPVHHHTRSDFSTTTAVSYKKMASDEDYMAFLDKANQDPSAGSSSVKTQDKKDEFKATDDGASVPALLQQATRDAFYVSDADEPFVPVCLEWDEGGKGLPDEEEFAKLIHHPDPAKATGSIELQDPADWDTQGRYKEIVDAVRAAGKGNDVRVYRVPRGGSRVEYWVVTTEGKGKDARLVGAKALAVES